MQSRRSSFGLNVGLKTLAKHLAALTLGVVVLLGFSQSAALASTISSESMPLSARADFTPNSLIALAASSRFAAQKESEGQAPTISEQRLDEIREQRREWQSEVSAEAAAESDNTTSKTSLPGAAKDKLNLDEITEENEIVGRIKNP
jgi:hypothetical protein